MRSFETKVLLGPECRVDIGPIAWVTRSFQSDKAICNDALNKRHKLRAIESLRVGAKCREHMRLFVDFLLAVRITSQRCIELENSELARRHYFRSRTITTRDEVVVDSDFRFLRRTPKPYAINQIAFVEHGRRRETVSR